MTTLRSRWFASPPASARLMFASDCSGGAGASGEGLQDGFGSRAKNRAAHFFTFYIFAGRELTNRLGVRRHRAGKPLA
ncbi:hypothetical protein [Actinomadura rudentiformis]|uniref:Uncharacterized protein n=1 Tax=Actinomadura rudentiformis TaxID=359158 RepID=A0A6H9YRE8_9ACTN|nr:hypothetical protein [Actinomadura rudentiformis]KAB2350268.1 hypothetical protein F8566_10815 [Actinomadura rudentiformis]